MKKIILFIIFVLVATSIFASSVYAQTVDDQPNGFYSMMGNWGWPMMGGYYGGFGWIFMVLWWLIIIVIIASLISWAVKQSRKAQDNNGKTPLDILKERYAKGEIDKEEFKAKKKDLNA